MERRKKLFLQTNIFLMRLSFALFMSLIAQMIPILQDYYNLSIEKTGLFMATQSLGGTLFMLFGAKLFDKYDKRYILFFAGAGFALLMFVFSALPPISIFFLLLILTGCANGTIDSMTNAITGENYDEKRSIYINILNVFFGIGAIIGPFLANSLFKQSGLKYVFAIFGLFVLIIVVLYFISVRIYSASDKKTKKSSVKMDYFRLKKTDANKVIKVGILIFLMGSTTITHLTWLSMYTSQHFGLDTNEGALVLSLYWGGRILGLLAGAKLTTKIETRKMIFYCSLFGSILFAIGVLFNTWLVFIITTTLTGIVFGNVEPQTMVLTMSYFPKRTGFAAAVFAIIASIAVTVVPYPLGLISKQFGLFYTLLCSSIFMAVLAFLTLIVVKKEEGVFVGEEV